MPPIVRQPRLNLERRKVERRASTPAQSPVPSHRRAPARQFESQRWCPECHEYTVEEQRGELACTICGTVVRELNNIVSEVTFGETSGGAAVVQGGFVREGQRSAKTRGAHLYGAAEAAEKGENSERTGNIAINSIAGHMQLAEAVVQQASRIYKLAVANNFTSGRTVRVVAAAALYVASRQKGGMSPMLLVDFAEAINVNVFTVGHYYSALKKALFLDDNQLAYKLGGADAPTALVNIEGVIYHYASRLEFGDRVGRVANDAARVLKRMRRDWMVTGRQPSGLVGACILIAARMNNYRRTVREVVLVVKACNITISKRLQEFSRTESSELTVEDFRAHGLRLRREAEPPIIYEKMKQDRKRKSDQIKALKSGLRGNPEMINDEVSIANESRESSAGANGTRHDAEGFAIPKLPKRATADNDTVAGAEKSAKGRGKKEATPKRKRAAANASPSAEQTPDDHEVASDDQDEAPNPKRPRNTTFTSLDPTDETISTEDARPEDGDETPAKRKRGRPKLTKEQRAISRARRIIEPEDLGEEQELEEEIEGIMEKPSVWSTISADEFDKFVEDAKVKAAAQREEERLMKRRASDPVVISDGDDDDASDSDDADETTGQEAGAGADGSSTSPITATPRKSTTLQASGLDSSKQPTPAKRTRKTKVKPPGRFNVSSDYEISESEFASDPEVAICTLSEADVRVKERIWTRDNEDWLRARQTKLIQKMIQEKHDAANGKNARNGAASGKRKKANRKLGDGSLIASKGRKPSSPAEAVRWQTEGKKTHSSKLDYRLVDMYKKGRTGQRKKQTASDAADAAGTAGAGVEATQLDAGREASAMPTEIGEAAAATVEVEPVVDDNPGGSNSANRSLKTPDPTQQDGTRASQSKQVAPIASEAAETEPGAIEPEDQGPNDGGEAAGDEVEDEDENEEDEGQVVGYDASSDDDDEGVDGGERAARKFLQDLGEDEDGEGYADDGGDVVFAGDREYGFDPADEDEDY